MSARLLVTGGASFIGSHLAEHALARGDRVLVLDDLSTGSLENLRHLEGAPGLEVHVGSALDAARVGALVERADAVLHLAAAVGVRLIVERPVHTIRTNVEATEVVLEEAARRGRPVLLASTSEVYGKSAEVPFREDQDLVLGAPSRSRWAYACSKALDEWLALAYARERGLPVVVVRLFNTVGPRQTGRYGMVLPTFARQAIRGEPLTVFGSGQQTRCFADVSDVVRCIRALLDTPAARGEIVNIGSTAEVTIEALAERTRALAGSASPIVRVPYAEAYAEGFEDMARRVPDVSKLERLLGMKPTTPLDEIVRRVLAYERSRA